MIYYTLLVVLILLMRYKAISMTQGHLRDSIELKYCKLIWIIIVLLAALRGIKVGADTAGYWADYLRMPFYSFTKLNDQYQGYLGYYYTSKVFSLLKLPVQVWFGFVEALYVYALYLLSKRFSKDLLLSILVFVTIGMFTFSMAGLKQVMSMSFMILAFLCFVDKKYVRTIVYILIASLCHSAGLIFLATIPLYWIRNRKIFLPLIGITGVASYFFGSLLLTTMVKVLGNDHFESYLVLNTSYSSVTLIFYCSIFIISIVGYESYKVNEPNDAMFILGMSLLICSMQALATISPNMFRLALCYAPFMMIMIPNVLFYSEDRYLRFIVIGSIIFYFLYVTRNTPYSFYWQ